MRVLVSGSSGLIGSAAALHYDAAGCSVVGIDHFRSRERTAREATLRRIREKTRRFTHHDLDLCDRRAIEFLFKASRFDLIIHAALHESYGRFINSPLDEFACNTLGTANLLETTRRCCADGVFVFVSTNRVYGDAPNRLPLVELETRFDFADAADYDGIAESCPIDQSLHGPFGVTMAAADLMVQEYGHYFGIRTGIFRIGCIAGPDPDSDPCSFLSSLVRGVLAGQRVVIHGRRGKAVRDPIDIADVIAAFNTFCESPRSGEVYNLGGGRDNSVSELEAVAMIGEIHGVKPELTDAAPPRRDEPACYITNLSKLRQHFPQWRISRSLPQILEAMPKSACV